MKTSNSISNRRFGPDAILLHWTAPVLAGLCLIVGTALAGGEGEAKREPKKEVRSDQKKMSESEGKTVITGSLIPQKVKRNRIPVTTSPVIIIGQNDIQRSGASTVWPSRDEVLRCLRALPEGATFRVILYNGSAAALGNPGGRLLPVEESVVDLVEKALAEARPEGGRIQNADR